MTQINRAMRRNPRDLNRLPGMPQGSLAQGRREAGTLPLAAYSTRLRRRMEALRRSRKGGAA